MFLLSIHGDLQLGKYSVYNTLCLQLTLLINCNRNTAISSLIAGRTQLYVSSLSGIHNPRLPNFQRSRGGPGSLLLKSNYSSLGHASTGGLTQGLLPRHVFAGSLLLKHSPELFVVEQGKKASWFCPLRRSLMNVLERVLAQRFPGGWGCVHGVSVGHAHLPTQAFGRGALPSVSVQSNQCCLLCLRARLSSTMTCPVVWLLPN